MSMCDSKNPQWDLMLFELNGNRLNEYGSQAYVEKTLADAGLMVVARHEYLKLSERLHKPDWRDSFLQS